MRHRASGELRYFHSSLNNARIFDAPFGVENESDFQNFVDAFDSEDFLTWAQAQRPNSEWVVLDVLNMTIFVNHIPDHPIGASSNLPDHVKHRQGLISVSTDDHLCFFHCLTLHKHPDILTQYHEQHIIRTKTLAKQYCQQWKEHKQLEDDTFEGVKMQDMEDLEQYFQVGINVYMLDTSPGNEHVAALERRANTNFEIMNLNLSETDQERHFSFIFDLSKYAKSYRCQSCGQRWKTVFSCLRHQSTCTRGPRHVYPSGCYEAPMPIFERLARVGVDVPNDMRYYPFWVTYDFEAYFEKADNGMEAKHRPLSFSVCSNVPGYTEPQCFVTDGDPDALIAKFLEILNKISDVAYGTLRCRYDSYVEDIQRKAKRERKREKKAKQNRGEEIDEDFEKMLTFTEKLAVALDDWLRQLIVLGFNSAKYDANLIKVPLMKLLQSKGVDIDPDEESDDDEGELDEDGDIALKSNRGKNPKRDGVHIIKKANAFVCISTPRLKLLDITQYLAPGVTYSKYLKAYEIPEEKGYFCYEYIDDLSKLEDTVLPPYEAFYSKLKECNVLDEEEGELAGRQRHAALEKIWQEKGMRTLRDFLIWYNNLDVVGFVKAVQKQAGFYADKRLDMFKDAISLPGLALKYSFQDIRAQFYHFGSGHTPLYHLVRDQIVGGPSIIFHRYHETGKTYIRQHLYGSDAKPTKTILGLDANALYLWAFGQPMPTGPFILRQGPDFTQTTSSKPYSAVALEWLRHMTETTGCYIAHAGNGPEIQIGTKKIPVDGFDAKTGTVYQFHGCFFHGHECQGEKEHPYHPGQMMSDIRQRTADMTQYIKDCGYEVIEQWECDWRRDQAKQKTPSSKLGSKPSQDKILQSIQDGTLFGLVHVDIRTPDHLKPRFAELPPIFKNTYVSRDDIGDFMKAYAEKTDTMKKPSRLLISSYHGAQILLATPLLKWYMDNGLEVTKVHRVIEYAPAACFAQVADSVSDARRQGDVSKDSAILAESMKLIGNSCYGKCAEDKSKHTKVYYTDSVGATRLANNRLFKKMNHMTDGLYEVECMKHKIVYDLPHHIAFFVYQYAKLKMLQLRYDLLDRFIDHSDYEMVEMDTDSCYMGLTTPDLESAVKPDMRARFYQEFDQWFPALACDRHKQDFIDTKLRGGEWVQADCCKKRTKYDKRTPGLFKRE